MSKYRDPLIVTVIGLLLLGGLGYAYQADQIAAGTLVFLGILVVTLAVVVAVFVSRLTHPPESVEEMLYKSDHPSRT